MKLVPSGVGAEPKKLAILGAIIVIGGAVYWFQNRSDSPTVSASVTPQTVPAVQTPAQTPIPTAPLPATPPAQQRRTPGVGTSLGSEDFHPTLKVKDDVNLNQVDPKIRLDLLAKLRAAPLEGGTSSLFEFSKPPEPPAPKVEIKPAPVPVPPPPPATKEITKGGSLKPPPPAPIPFKYFGYAGKAADGQLQEGLFFEGDPNTGALYLKREGDVIKDHYKIIRIGIRSAVVEDTTNHNQQTLQLLEEKQ